jgi:3-oxoacyl-[acyl-carrier-protein] synthase II
MNRDKIVITGLGTVAPNGNTTDQFWESLISSKSGIGPITYFDASKHRVSIAGQLSNFTPDKILSPKEIKKLDPFSVYALVAAEEAISMSGLDFDKINLNLAGVTIGTGVGGIQTLEEQHSVISNKGARRVSPHFVPKMISNIAGGQLSIKWGLKGPNQTITSACASANDAIGLAMRLILAGDADIMITGGTEASVTPLTIAGFANMRALSQSCEYPKRASRPFDKNRDGFVLGEGAGIIVIERESHALSRKANILAELAGYGSTDDAFHVTQPSEGGLGGMKAMERALSDASLNTNEIDYINAHGTSTPFNDKNESRAITKLFLNNIDTLKVSSTKSMTGHLLGATGAIEAIASVKAINNSILPPTINYDTPDPECALDFVPNYAQDLKINAVLSNNFGFGGHNSVLCLKKYD